MKKRKPVVVWAARGKTNIVTLYDHKPSMNGGEWIESKSSDFIDALCVEMLENVTGFSLKPGECKRVVISITVVK